MERRRDEGGDHRLCCAGERGGRARLRRAFDYTAGAEQALETASRQNWTVVSMKNDWNTVFTGTA
jgi:hypothetical protein